MFKSAEPYRNAITSKELNRLADHVRNEATLAYLCTQAAVECANPQLRGFFAHQAEERSRKLEDLSGVLQKYAGFGR
ncbi:spore coat protein [Paenibacillus alkalitolerans]|uniref:spore coat protein n=1 Tax=Paenibacillus alkalitolerans TaxID=2799335 RepID=UPI0018F3BBD6|nr:spore coat protein [Paenibacillus alkalitolerans]